jgi:hypothetical protein
MRFEGLLERHERGELSQGEAAEMLGVSERTFRRWRNRLRDEGLTGLARSAAWLPGNDRQYDLVVTLDDATSAVYSAFNRPGGGHGFELSRTGRGNRHGLFCELYTDRGSHYFHTPKAGEPVSKSVQTRAGAARHPPHRSLFARGARPLGARVP